MKSFFTTFLACYVILLILAILGFSLVYNNFYILLAVVTLPIAAVIEGFSVMGDRIEQLEKRIEELEGKKEYEAEYFNG